MIRRQNRLSKINERAKNFRMKLREKREYPGIKMSDFLKIDLSRYEDFKINIGNTHMSGFDWTELDNYEDMILYKIDFLGDEVSLYLKEGKPVDDDDDLLGLLDLD